MPLVGERRAIAAAVLSFFMLELLLAGFIIDDPMRAVRLALGAAYLVAFLGVVSGWFWARWYTLGLAFSGVALAVMIAWQIGLDPAVYFIGGGHLALGIGLLGTESASFYEGRHDWRERWRMDENAVNRLGKAVMRAGASLPYLIVAGLAPKGQGLGTVALVLGVLGLTGLVRMRVWGLLVLGAGAIVSSIHLWGVTISDGVPGMGPTASATAMALGLLAASVAPFAASIVRSLRSR